MANILIHDDNASPSLAAAPANDSFSEGCSLMMTVPVRFRSPRLGRPLGFVAVFSISPLYTNKRPRSTGALYRTRTRTRSPAYGRAYACGRMRVALVFSCILFNSRTKRTPCRNRSVRIRIQKPAPIIRAGAPPPSAPA